MPANPPRVVLGITLGGGELGTVVLARSGPLHLRVLNLWKVPSVLGKQARFRQRVENLVDAFPLTHVVAVLHESRSVDVALARAERAWLRTLARSRHLRLTRIHRHQVIRRALGKPKGATRDLAEFLEGQYPCLWNRVPRSIPLPNPELVPSLTWRNRRVVPPKERYWRGALVACAAAHLILHHNS